MEVAQDFADRVHNGEGVWVAPDDPVHRGNLGLVHHTQQHAGFPPGVHALAGNQGGGVVDVPDDVPRNFVGIIGDDLKGNGGPAGLHQPFAYIG